jgi:hypothetical protein
MHTEELQNLYSSPNIMTAQLREITLVGHVEYKEEVRNA